MSFLNSTKTYKSEGFLLIHGTGIGIHGIIDLYQNLLYEIDGTNHIYKIYKEIRRIIHSLET